MANTRRWTLEAARAMLADIRARTESAVLEVEALLAERGLTQADSAEREAYDERIRARVSRWARSMEALGVEVKGPWLVDFDNGSGYYCWQWPEEELEYFHTHEEGFAGRARIQ